MTETPAPGVDPRALLEMAGRVYPGRPGAHEQAMRDELDLSAIGFWRQVVALLDDPPAEVVVEWAPTIARLRRLRAGRVARRSPVRRAG